LANVYPHLFDNADYIAGDEAYKASKIKPEASPVKLFVFSIFALIIAFISLYYACKSYFITNATFKAFFFI